MQSLLTNSSAHTPSGFFPMLFHAMTKDNATCFDVFASLWVFGYEKMVPSALRETRQIERLDELRYVVPIPCCREELDWMGYAHILI